ncbi:hypothetical protein J3B02_002679 [Coemansia erecta]|nr:hypothetical protein J3B02_002679 [Coemansia erecta]KAJ2885402.1 hypothetical protein FB639_001778 [Coemansia asiatica]
MPEPVYANESSTDNGQGGRTGNVSDSRVGGFVQPLKVPILSEESTATIGSAKKAVSPATSTAQDITMPMPADNPTGDNAFDGVSVVPAGFVPYLTSSQIASMANWPVFNVPSTAATSGGAVPGMYGGGVVPMPFPPHIAMQYGYVPPQIHGMQPISPAAGIGPPGIGDNSDIGNPKTGAVAASAKDSTGSLPDAIEQQQANHTSHQAVGGNVIQPTAIAPGIRGNPLGEDMWIPANAIAAHHHQGNEQGSQIGTPTPIIAASGLQGMSATPPLAAGSYQYPAMTAAAAAAAAGYSMATPFTYPHVDASSLSTAATGGGSENNDSVNSGDSASNRGNGVPSRPNSMHHYPQLTPDGQRGFAQAVNMNMGMNMGMVDYPQTAPYVWPQQAESYHHPHHQHQHHHQPYAKAMQTAMYAGYSHQNQADNQQQSSFQQPQQQQQQQQQSQLSHGYRRRGSGSNSNNSNNSSSNGGASTSHHSQYSRDRRGHNGNGGYQRQQRWHNNNNSNNSINNGGGSGNSHHRQHNHYSQQG